MASGSRAIRMLGTVPWVCLTAALACGCDTRELSWSYAPDAPALIRDTKTAAIAVEPIALRGASEESREVVAALSEELMRRGYSVVILEDAYPTYAVGVPAPGQPAPAPAQPGPTPAPPAPPSVQPPPPPAPPAPAPAQPAEPSYTNPAEPTSSPPAVPPDEHGYAAATSATPAPAAPAGASAPPRVVITGSLPGRYVAAREARAGILLEVSAGVHRTVEVYETGGPYRHYGYYGYYGRRGYWGYGYYPRETYVREYRSIPRATLRIINPADRTLLATVTVQYDSPADRPADVANDLCLGFDFVRQSWPPQRVTLKGPPEKVEFKTDLLPPPAPATQPTTQP